MPSNTPRAVLVSLLAAAGVACLSAAAHAQVNLGGVSFLDRAARGEITLGRFRGSLGVIDYDNDGFYDLFINDNLGSPKRLFHNVPSATTPGGRTFVDVSAAAGFTTDADGIARNFGGVVVFDYDNDGFSDIYTVGVNPNNGTNGLLYHNNGNGTFTNLSVASGVRTSGFNPTSASAVDFNHDGLVDLFVNATGSPGKTLTLFENNGDGTFTQRRDLFPPDSFSGTVYANAWTDYDHDGWEDWIVLENASRPLLLKNAAGPGGSRVFVDATTQSGFTFVGPAPMGIALGDVDNDGWLDIAITDAVSGTYYHNSSATSTVGTLTRVQPYSTFFGWGTCYIDAENDGDLDNYQAGSFGAGNVDRLLRNENNGASFTDVRDALNTTALASQFSAKVDFDNDGREDIITVNPNNFVSIYHNQATGGNHWFSVKLLGAGNVSRDAVGARVLVTAGGITRVREAAIGTSYSATEDPRLHFGIGAATTIESIQVIWPRQGTLAGRTETFSGPFAADQIITLSPQVLCNADVNADGDVDAADLDALINAIAGGTNPASFPTDVNRDGSSDAGDIDALLNIIAGGACP
ncbi:MAG: FG-GAP-like repeat-containing protein [Phycisphaerales bacterium]